MAVTSWIRRQFKDGVITTATTTMTAVATSFSVGSGQGSSFPDGSIGPFIVTVDQNQAAEEKILVQSRTADTFAVATNGRGYNGTTAQAHTNAVVLHTIDAQDLDEANQTAVQTLGAIQASGDLLQGSGANALQRLARGTTGQVLQAGASLLSWVGFGVGQSQPVGSANADGTATTMCHPDHVHAGVTSFNSRQGAVVATTGDYTAAQVTNAADKSSATTQAFTGAISSSSTVTGTALIATLTGTNGRLVGATNGAPATGTGVLGDIAVDYTNSQIWICTTAGSPGTWTAIPGTDSGWQTPTLLNSYTASTPVRYRKIANRVEFLGSLTSGPSNTTAFTLPSGYYYPTTAVKLPTVSGIAANAATAAWVQVDTAGNVIPEFSTPSGAILALDGLSFLVS